MKPIAILIALGVLLVSLSARGESELTAPEPTAPKVAPSPVLVERSDLDVLLLLARQEKCRQSTMPTVTANPITVTMDRQGRVFASGTGPQPFTVQMQWCNYLVEAKGQVAVLAARMPEPTWGWRFRVKATLGYLPMTALAHDARGGFDAGVLLEPFYWNSLNLNGYVGVRSAGAGLGLDLTRNVGAYLGYAMTWTGESNIHAGLSFALW